MQSVERLLAMVEELLPRLTSPAAGEGVHSRQFAAAALARCTSLFRGIYLVTIHNQEDAAGPSVRALCETWGVGMYALLGPPHAIPDLAHDAAEFFRKMKNEYEELEPLTPELARFFDDNAALFAGLAQQARKDKHGNPRKFNYRDLFYSDLPPLLARHQPAWCDLSQVAYTHVYRPETMFGSHAGFLSIEGYIDDSGDPWRVRRRPRRPYQERNALNAGALLLGHLASAVAAAFGFDGASFEEALNTVKDELKAAPPDSGPGPEVT